MRTIVCGRWNRHSSSREEACERWRKRNDYDAGKIGFPELLKAEDALTRRFISELEATGVDFLSDGSFRHDSIFDVVRAIQGCTGFKQLTRIPETNHFHRQWQATLPFSLSRSMLGSDLAFAKQCTSKPVVMCLPGPYSLARQTSNVAELGLENLSLAYAEVLRQEVGQLLNGGAAYVRIEEPQILAHAEQDWPIFQRVMAKLTEGLDQSRVILASWYGGIESLENYFALPFGIFWLDFVEAGHWSDYLEDLPKGKQIVAGVFDARHTYEDDLRQVYKTVKKVLKYVPEDRLLLSTNTDLHFLPYDAALEKTQHLVSFARDFSKAAPLQTPDEDRISPDDDLDIIIIGAGGKLIGADGKPLILVPDHNIARGLFHELAFPTSTVGSFPQPQELRKARVALRRGEMDETAYCALVEKHTKLWMDLQHELDITLPVGGEFSREDMAAFFGVHFGCEMKDFVPSYENRRYRPIEYGGRVHPASGATLPDFRMASALTVCPYKETVTGPATMAAWALIRNPDYYRGRAFFRRDLARVLRAEIDLLVAAGMKVLQVDEPALTTRMSDFFMDLEAIEKVVRGLEDRIYLILHICYSDMEALDQAFPHMLRLPFHQIHIEMANRAYAPLRLIEKHGFNGRDIGLGVLDVHTDRIETVDEIVEGVKRVRKFFRPDQIWLTPDCGLKERSDEVARAKLRVMSEAAKICRQTLV